MSARATVVALARIEGRRLVRQPLVLATAAITGPLFAALILVAGRDAYYDWSLVVPFVPFAVAMLVAVNLAAMAPTIVALCGTLGLALACWLPHRAVAATVALVMLVAAGAGGDWSGPSRWPRALILAALGLTITLGALAMLRSRSQLA